MPQIEMTRQELHDLVWSKPMAQAAASLPMSHHSFKKLCQKHEIPLPPLGHWKKSADNQVRDRIPLPASLLGQERLWVRRFLQRRRANHRTVACQALVATSPAENGAWRHECTKRTEAALKQAEPNHQGALVAVGEGIASARVAPDTVPRALQFLDALLHAGEATGYSISSTFGAATLVVGGERVQFAILEEFETNRTPPDEAEIARRESYRLRWPQYSALQDHSKGWRYRPSGKLTVVLGENGRDGQHLWADRGSIRVETRISTIVADAAIHAKAIGARRLRAGDLATERRVSEQERMLRAKRLTFLTERAEMLDDAEKLSRLRQHLHSTDDGSSPRVPNILNWLDAYVAELRNNCAAAVVDREATNWGFDSFADRKLSVVLEDVGGQWKVAQWL